MNKYEVKEQHRALVEFRQINLCSDWSVLPGKWDYEPVFDIILLRNVLSYFPEEKRKELLAKIPFHMHAGSYLILGKGENIPEGVIGFDLCDEKLGIYRRNDVVVPKFPHLIRGGWRPLPLLPLPPLQPPPLLPLLLPPPPPPLPLLPLPLPAAAAACCC